jgi:hypothetical protein
VIASPLRPRQRQESGIAAATARPPRNALRRFTFVRHHDAPMASFRPALTEAPAAPKPAALGTARSIPSRALATIGVGFPLSGSRDRTSTSDLNIRTWHTCTRPTASLRSTPAQSTAFVVTPLDGGHRTETGLGYAPSVHLLQRWMEFPTSQWGQFRTSFSAGFLSSPLVVVSGDVRPRFSVRACPVAAVLRDGIGPSGRWSWGGGYGVVVVLISWCADDEFADWGLAV